VLGKKPVTASELERAVGVEIAERLAASHGHRFDRDEAAQSSLALIHI